MSNIRFPTEETLQNPVLVGECSPQPEWYSPIQLIKHQKCLAVLHSYDKKFDCLHKNIVLKYLMKILLKVTSTPDKVEMPENPSGPVAQLSVTAAEEPPPSHKNSLEYFRHAEIEGLPEILGAKKVTLRMVWLIVLVVSNAACLVHTYFLLATFIQQPNGLSMTVEAQDAMILPRIQICRQYYHLNLPPDANITNETIYALEMGVGFVRLRARLGYYYNLNYTLFLEQLEKFGADPVLAYQNFHQQYGYKCHEIFSRCSILSGLRPIDCCDVFEPIFTLQGMCWVSKKDFEINGSDTFANFRFNLLHHDPEPYYVSFSDSIDQGDYYIEEQRVDINNLITVKLTQSRQQSMPNAKLCSDEGEELDFFGDYSVTNCNLERGSLQPLFDLLNEPCELPMVELLNLNYKSENLCNFTQILTIFDYRDIFNRSVDDDVIDRVSDWFSFDLRPRLSIYCNVWHNNQSTLPECSPKSFFSVFADHTFPFPAEWNAKFNKTPVYFNTVPRTLKQSLGLLKKSKKTVTSGGELCLPLCDTITHNFEYFSELDKQYLPPNESQVVIQYTTKEVVTFKEEPRQSLAEYISMIGGNIGMWNGAHAVAVIHLFALVFRTFVIRQPLVSG